MPAIGEVKIPGGKLVRVTVADAAGTRTCHIDGDFFAAGERSSAAAIAQAEEVLAGRLSALDAPGVAIEPWYRATVRALEPIVERVLIGANAESIALAALRAHAQCAPEPFAQALARFEGERNARIHRQWQAAQHGEHPQPPLIDPREVHERWRALAPVLVEDRPRMPEEQMRVEREWSRQVAHGARPATLRVWDWGAPAVVCGAYQSIEDEVRLDQARGRGVHVVRRDSGGGAMYIEPARTITVSLYAPLGFVQGLDVAQSFQLCDMWLIEGLRACGVRACFAGLNDIAGPHGKIGGSAQQRVPGDPGCVLHHTTLAYSIDARAMGAVLNTSAEKMSDKAVKSAVKRVEPICAGTRLTRAQVVARLVRTARAFGAL
ncbi:lipoate--protein ligase family protein [Bifidobacterium pseudolongum]|uniref:lipoate--protein ligase family protein n=1 Tax=Bifidobacterium pseudolongum TaxID=1694 RepID=UPI00050822E8|nr:lipoate--protein ligase family protein [Bifidobacterium pseudolongum]ASW23759.1 biotin/lipoate A/B ligase family protein [Bifidobacterium pseudolongum]KFI76757.1 lipoate protein ligase [Bifidobacterium pseudolongum subsp. pseudolongum]MCH4851930.1 lipoate--protein ligase family protein [Bifidobacterium pseudolongum]MDY3689257.1 lipoate--protein ligase family protein [Bifidobacterium pseudolongum]PKU99453.1 lipoate-protein ligase A [Bifidobacterium pseudolongum subsp. pseudolongum]